MRACASVGAPCACSSQRASAGARVGAAASIHPHGAGRASRVRASLRCGQPSNARDPRSSRVGSRVRRVEPPSREEAGSTTWPCRSGPERLWEGPPKALRPAGSRRHGRTAGETWPWRAPPLVLRMGSASRGTQAHRARRRRPATTRIQDVGRTDGRLRRVCARDALSPTTPIPNAGWRSPRDKGSWGLSPGAIQILVT